MKEIRTALDQPAGHVGEQVTFFDDDWQLTTAHLLSRNPVTTAFLSVGIYDGQATIDDPNRLHPGQYVPRIAVGWETYLDSKSFLTEALAALPERNLEDILVDPPLPDVQHANPKYPDNPYLTTSIEQAISEERIAVELNFTGETTIVSYKDEPSHPFYPRHAQFHTTDRLRDSESDIRQLIFKTAAPEKRDAILATLPALHEFYDRYVALDLKLE